MTYNKKEDPFWYLQKPYKEVTTSQDFWKLITASNKIECILYRPPKFIGGEGEKSKFEIKGKTFENISLGRTEIKNIEFHNCIFINCIFIRTKFIELEFHDCSFKNCNMGKCSIKDTYIHPSSFDNCFNKNHHANVGLHLYQQLMRNLKDMDQPDLYKTAEYEFRLWQRHELEYKIREKIGDKFSTHWKIFCNKFFQSVFGYGIKLKIFLRTTVILITVFWVINYLMWGFFGLGAVCDTCRVNSWHSSFYYTVISLSNLGYGDIVPATWSGRLWASLQAIVGAVWFAGMASMIFKKFSR